MTGRTTAHSIAAFVATLTIGLALATPAAADPPAEPVTPTSETPTTPAPQTMTAPPPGARTPAQPSPSADQPAPPENPAAAPAPAEQQRANAAADRAQLEVTGEFDQPSYATGDLITIKLRIKNVGTEKATGLSLSQQLLIPTDLRFNSAQLGELNTRAGAIEPGATLEKTLSGHLGQADADVVTLTGNIFDREGRGLAEFKFSAPVKKTVSHVAGVVFGDKNGNGALDNGEQLAGTKLTLSYADGGQIRFLLTATSGSEGKFDFGDVPTVRYSVSGEASGWIFPSRTVDIKAANDNTNLRIRASAPLNGALHASMEFTKDSYQVGELAHVKVTLSNSGSIPLVDIQIGCDRSGEGPQLLGNGPSWSVLNNGVTLGAGETKEFDVSENVPESGRNFGYVLVACDFGISDADIDNHEFAADIAIVPTDLRATFGGTVQSFPDGPGKPGVGLAGVRVVLTDDGPCPILGDTTTNGDGKFEFTNLVPGPDRKVYLVPPHGWSIESKNPADVFIVANRENREDFTAVQRDGAAPAVPTQPDGCTTPAPEPQGRSGGGLASTGASVVGLSAIGALALFVGAGTLVTVRRRRRNAVS